MKNNIKLSVLITFCNQKEFIRDAIESVLKQRTQYSYEVLIGLDCPDEESKSIIQSYIEKYSFIKLFETDNSNKDIPSMYKASLNRINLLKHASGEYFTLLDGDDFYCVPYRFEKLISFLEENYNCIGAFHDYNLFDNQENLIKEKDFFANNERTYDIKKYYKYGKHICNQCYIWRNIFLTKFPDDFDENLFNDTYIIAYMLRYGEIHYFPEVMLSYRTNIDSIYNSQQIIIKYLYEFFFLENRCKLLPNCKKYFIKNFRKLIIKFFKNYREENNKDLKLINKVSDACGCYFTNKLSKYSQLSCVEKLKLYTNIINLFVFGIYPVKTKVLKLLYYTKDVNFGDVLNLYILQRLFGLKIYKSHKWNADIMAIGSLLEVILKKKNKIFMKEQLNKHPVKVLGTGFTNEQNKQGREEKLVRVPEILAMRGKLSLARIEKMLKQDLSTVPLGDIGLLASFLIDETKIRKCYKVGVIPHYVDKDSQYLDNIILEGYKLIDVQKNPIWFIKEVAECEVILSSALHGLITADALNIPNRRIVFSDKIVGGDYKFRDYYSAFDIDQPLEPIDLRENKINEQMIENIIDEYNSLDLKFKIDKIKERLLNLNLN